MADQRSCIYCNKPLSKPSNKKRHEKYNCPKRKESAMAKNAESKQAIKRDIFGEVSDTDSDVEMNTEDDVDDEIESDDSSADGDKINAWKVIALEVNKKAKQEYQKVLDKYLEENLSLDRARKRAYKKLYDYLLDTFQDVYLSMLRLQRALQLDKTNQRILRTAKRLRDGEEFDFDESIKYAVRKRRFLLAAEMDKAFRSSKPPASDDEDENVEESGGDDEDDEKESTDE